MALRMPARLRRRFTLYTDDTGQPSIRPPDDPDARHVFAYGGIVVPNDRIANMKHRWGDLKAEVFGTRDEVKAEDFVREDSPIPDNSDAVDRRTLAQGMLAVTMDALALRPVGCFVDKANIPEHFIIKGGDGAPKRTKKGFMQLDKRWPFELVVSIFGQFLRLNGARGRLICDEPGQGRLDDWHACFDALKARDAGVARIDSLAFRRSHEEPGIELADVTVGLMRYAQERREVIVDGLVDVLRRAQGDALGIVHAQG